MLAKGLGGEKNWGIEGHFEEMSAEAAEDRSR